MLRLDRYGEPGALPVGEAIGGREWGDEELLVRGKEVALLLGITSGEAGRAPGGDLGFGEGLMRDLDRFCMISGLNKALDLGAVKQDFGLGYQRAGDRQGSIPGTLHRVIVALAD